MMVLPPPVFVGTSSLQHRDLGDGDAGGDVLDAAAGLLVFPTVLLVTTLLRLSLNVASTRIVLLEGHAGPDTAGKGSRPSATSSLAATPGGRAGVFIILTVINFVVITMARRIAEVSARFTLDAMPGKQMAIDADLSPAWSTRRRPRRRKEIAQESTSTAPWTVRPSSCAATRSPASSSWRSTSSAAFVGIMQHDMAVGDAAHTHTLLTIGDGLVAQIPSLIVSVAAGLVVSRVGDEGDVGGLVIGQLFSNPQVMWC